MPSESSPPVADGTALLHNLLDRAIVIGASGLEFRVSGEVFATVDQWSGRLDANPQAGKFALYGAGIRSLSSDSTQFLVKYEGNHESKQGEYLVTIRSYDSDKIVLEIPPKP